MGSAVVVVKSPAVNDPTCHLKLSFPGYRPAWILSQTLVLFTGGRSGKIETERINHLDSLNAEKQKVSLEEFQRNNANAIPLGRYGSTEEMAKMMLFLCSEANTYITGQNILIDGGSVQAY
jgi:3-oxoacyl-[acyl-carrier protein] reductase